MASANSSNSLFGPVSTSRSFDFTLLFEDTILTIVPATLFLVAAGARVLWLLSKPNKVAASISRLTKLVLLSAFTTVQLAVLILRATNLQVTTKASVAASALDFAAACILFVLSCFEHSRSVAPSTIIGLYLIISVPFDAVRLRTHYLLASHAATSIAAFLSLSLIVKCTVLVTEAVEKRSLLLGPYQDLPPEATSGVYNKSVFWWLNPLLKVGFGKNLHVEDLFNLDQELASTNISTKFRQKWARAKLRGPHTLLLTTGRVLIWQLVVAALPRLILSAARFSQPFLNRTTITYISNRDDQQKSVGWGIVGAYFLVFLVQGLASAAYQHLLDRCAAQIRGGLISLIYRKTLKLRVGATDPTASLTLMSSDIQRMVETVTLIHDTWLGFLDVCIAMFLLYLELGRACYAPAIVYVIQILGTSWVTKLISTYQKRWLEAIQTRVSFTSALLHSVRNVKLLGLSAIIKQRTQRLRLDEIEACKKYRVMNNFVIFFQNSAGVFAPFATFLLYYLQARASNQPLDLATSFSILTILRLVETPLNTLCYSTPHMASSIACFHRIQQYLTADQWRDARLELSSAQDPDEVWSSTINGRQALEMRPLGSAIRTSPNEALVLKDCSFGWSNGDVVLRDIDISVCDGCIAMVIGPVGCGKSTLIKSILSETHLSQGFVYLRTNSIAFADQEPWIQNGTIRDAIRGPRSWENQPLDDQWYQEVIVCCGLLEDLKFFARGDMTFIGSKGISLSGGQKQRIALARALYSKPDILLLDDVFSGLDNDTEDHIFRNVFGHSGLVRRESITVVMVTHAAHRLPYADLIVSLNRNGRVTEQGNYSTLARSGGYVQSLDIRLKQDQPDENHAGSPDDIQTAQANKTSEISTQTDDDGEQRDLIRRTGDWSAYKYWFKSSGYISSALSFVEALLWMGAVQTPGILIKIFSNGNSLDTSASSPRSTTFIVVFGVTAVIAALSLVTMVWQILIDMVPRSSRNLHLNLLQTVLDAPLSFFTRTDIGTITNRFSQDMGLIDADLPMAYADFILSFVQCIAGLGLMSASGSGYFAATIPVLIFVLYLVQRYYLRTSRQMRLLDLEQKAPLYTMFAETSSGIPTIRAFGWTESFADRNLALLDRSQRPFYLMLCIQRWLALILDMIVVILVTVLLVVIISQRSSIEPGLAAIGLLSTVGLSSSLTNLVRMWSALETSIGAISRLREFLQTTESEHEAQEIHPVRHGWPENGEVEFHSFNASYAKDSDLILKDISLKVRLGERLGICGRSGSGKSSMLASLFHLLEFRSGQIVIDGVDVATLPRELLRSRVNVIPQEPWWITTETVRFNMDPWRSGLNDDTSSMIANRDEVFISALSRCQVWQVIKEKGGLSAIMTSDFLSHGQRQLFCLARAMLRQSKVIILDEVSANVDLKTDALMQQVIREHFLHCTIIAVAHRLNTIEDSDRVVVLSQGRIVEVGEPAMLLNTPGSRFKELYEK